MRVLQAINCFLDYHRMNPKKIPSGTMSSYLPGSVVDIHSFQPSSISQKLNRP